MLINVDSYIAHLLAVVTEEFIGFNRKISTVTVTNIYSIGFSDGLIGYLRNAPVYLVLVIQRLNLLVKSLQCNSNNTDTSYFENLST